MLTLLDIRDGQEDLFNQTNSCSDTEQLDDKSLKIVQCPWQSSEFTQLAHELDKFLKKIMLKNSAKDIRRMENRSGSYAKSVICMRLQ